MANPSVCSTAKTATEAKTPKAISREIALFARHWAWISAQPRSANATLRLLVEQASRDVRGEYRAKKLKEECYFLMRDMAGDNPCFEEASRALFSNNLQQLTELIANWPVETANRVIALAAEACRIEATTTDTRSL